MENITEPPALQNLADSQKDLLERLQKQEERSIVYRESMHKSQMELMQAILNEQRAQTIKLSKISTIVSIWGVLMILGAILAVLGSCAAFLGM